jgi:hypothetical protein
MNRKCAHSIAVVLGVMVAVAGVGAGCSGGSVDPETGGSSGAAPTGTAGAATAGSAPVGNTAGSAPVGMPQGGGASGSGPLPTGGTFSGGGVTGSPGGASTGGSNASAGSGPVGSGGRASGPSAGCKTPVTMEEPQKAIQHDLTVNVAAKYLPAYATRKYYTSLPQNFDPAKPYPMIFYGQGCGQVNAEGGPFSGGHFATETLYIQLIPAVVTGDTVVPKSGAPGCFQAGKQGLADSPDGPYFDQVLAEVEQKYCVDTGKVYVAGWSSGAWLSNYLACARGNVITGTAAGSGGLQHDHGTCTGGGVKAMVLDGDAGSIMEGGFDIGAAVARDTLVMASGAGMPASTKLGPDTCQVYAGTNGSVAWCPVGGGHGGPLNTIADAAWAFWNAP